MTDGTDPYVHRSIDRNAPTGHKQDTVPRARLGGTRTPAPRMPSPSAAPRQEPLCIPLRRICAIHRLFRANVRWCTIYSGRTPQTSILPGYFGLK